MNPYYADDQVTLYLGDCREVTEWLAADVLVGDPPYGRGWSQGNTKRPDKRPDSHPGIIGDADTRTRDDVLTAWGERPAVMFGDLMFLPPVNTRQVLIYHKVALNAGLRGAMAGFRRDAEAIYLIGPWPSGFGGRTSIIGSAYRGQASFFSQRDGHPHAKPVDVLETLIAACPPGVIADPFTGSGSTLVAARNQGRRAIGIEIDERYCEQAARRLSQQTLVAP